MQAEKLVFTFQFLNSAIFLIVWPLTFSSVGKNPQDQRTEKHYSWEASSSFVRSFHLKMNKENITCDIQKHPPWAIHFSAGRKGKKASSPSSPFFLWCTDGFFNAAKRVHHAQFARTKPDFGFWVGEWQEWGTEFLVTSRAGQLCLLWHTALLFIWTCSHFSLCGAIP